MIDHHRLPPVAGVRRRRPSGRPPSPAGSASDSPAGPPPPSPSSSRCCGRCPTFGLFVSSLRPEDEIESTGWWNVFTDPQFTLAELPGRALRPYRLLGQLRRFFINSLVITIPSVLFPLALRGDGGVRARLDELPRPGLDLHRRSSRCRSCRCRWPWCRCCAVLHGVTSPGPGAAGLAPPRNASCRSGSPTPCFALPLAVFLLHNFMSELPERPDGGRPGRRGRARAHLPRVVLPLSVPAHRRRSRSSSSSGSGTTCWSR